MRRGAASALLRVPTFRYSALVDSLFCACVAARSSALCYGWMYSVVCCVTTQHSVVCCVTAPAGALCRGALHRLGEAVDSCRFLPRRPCPPSGCPAAAGLRPLQARSSGPAQPEPGEPRQPRGQSTHGVCRHVRAGALWAASAAFVDRGDHPAPLICTRPCSGVNWFGSGAPRSRPAAFAAARCPLTAEQGDAD